MKLRPIDDLSESLINASTSRTEAVTPHGIDMVCRALVFRLRHRSSCGLPNDPVVKATDLRKAYKQLALAPSALDDANIGVADPKSGNVHIFRSTVLPFGSAASVSAFCRASHAVWFAAVTLLWLHTTVFFDDFFTICEKMSANHVNLCLNSFFSLLGWDLATEKDAMFLACARILGVVIDLASEMVVKICNTSERKEELCREITSILERGSYTTSVICSLRGRLLFAESQVFGRACYRHMKTIGDRVKSHRNRKVDRDLKNALEYMRDRVVLGPPRVIHAARAEPLHIFTDASFETSRFSGLGAVLVEAWVPTKIISEECTRDVLRALGVHSAENPIYVLEALAVVIALQTFQPFASGRDVIIFLDNDGALGSFIACKTSLPEAEPILQFLVEHLERSFLALWYERVSSEANIADGPFRNDVSLLAGVDRVSVDLLRSVVNIAGCGQPEREQWQ